MGGNLSEKSINVEMNQSKKLSTEIIEKNVDNPVDNVDN